MIVIAILAIPFIFYFVQRPDYGAIGRDQFARIYDRNISMLEAQQFGRLLSLAQALGMSDFVGTMTAGAGLNQNQAAVQFIVNVLVLRHEAGRLGLRPSASEVAEVVRKLPAFQGDSGFDINKFNALVQNGLAPLGLAEEHIEQLVRDQICLNEIQKLLAAGVSLPKSELDENFQRGYDKLYVSVIRFRSADFDKDVKINDEDVQKYYDAHKAELKTDEKRKVEFINLSLTPEQKKLTGKERIDALQKLADRANDVTQALLEKGGEFHQVATKFQLPIEATGEFTANSPDPKLKADPQLAIAAFQLTAQEPNSDAIQAPDGFYILHLLGVESARPLSLEEARPRMTSPAAIASPVNASPRSTAPAAGRSRTVCRTARPERVRGHGERRVLRAGGRDPALLLSRGRARRDRRRSTNVSTRVRRSRRARCACRRSARPRAWHGARR